MKAVGLTKYLPIHDPFSLMDVTLPTSVPSERDQQFERVKTHGSLATSVTLWFTMLSPLIGLIIAFLGAWFFSQLSG
jgi:hypothetical protein